MTQLLRFGPKALFVLLAFAIVAALFAAPVMAQQAGETASPETAPSDANKAVEPSREDLPLVDQPSSPMATRPADTPDLLKLFLYTGLVIGLIVLLMWLIKRYLPGGKRLFGSDAIQVIARKPIDGNNVICLVLVGNKILKLAVSKTDVVVLGEESDPKEVAYLRMKCNAGKKDGSEADFDRELREATSDLASTDKNASRADGAMKIENQLEDIKKTMKGWKDGK